MKCPEQATPQVQDIEQWLPGAGSAGGVQPGTGSAGRVQPGAGSAGSGC